MLSVCIILLSIKIIFLYNYLITRVEDYFPLHLTQLYIYFFTYKLLQNYKL